MAYQRRAGGGKLEEQEAWLEERFLRHRGNAEVVRQDLPAAGAVDRREPAHGGAGGGAVPAAADGRGEGDGAVRDAAGATAAGTGLRAFRPFRAAAPPHAGLGRLPRPPLREGCPDAAVDRCDRRPRLSTCVTMRLDVSGLSEPAATACEGRAVRFPTAPCPAGTSAVTPKLLADAAGVQMSGKLAQHVPLSSGRMTPLSNGCGAARSEVCRGGGRPRAA